MPSFLLLPHCLFFSLKKFLFGGQSGERVEEGVGKLSFAHRFTGPGVCPLGPPTVPIILGLLGTSTKGAEGRPGVHRDEDEMTLTTAHPQPDPGRQVQSQQETQRVPV